MSAGQGFESRVLRLGSSRNSPVRACYDRPCPSIFQIVILERGDRCSRADFAYAPRPGLPPSDVIDEGTWKSLVVLPDDVAVRTSNYHGTAIRQLHYLWEAWVETLDGVDGCLATAMLDAGDDFQSSTYTALTGFYRLSIAALRSALELVAIGTWAKVCNRDQEFQQWRNGKRTLSFGAACDGLIAATDILRMELRETAGDTLFDQKDSASEGGSREGSSVASPIFRIRVRDERTVICATAAVRFTSAWRSNTQHGFIPKLSGYVSCFFLLRSQNYPCRTQSLRFLAMRLDCNPE